MTNSEMTVEIVEKIRDRDQGVLTSIYKDGYPMVEKYILTNNGTKADAQDIFQDAMYLLIKKVESPEFSLHSKITTFLFGIGKNLWLKQLAKHKTVEREPDPNEVYEAYKTAPEIEEADFEKLDRVKWMKKCLVALGEPCKTILEQFYFFKTPMKRIAEMLHYTNANNAKNQKYKCFMRLKKMVLTGNDKSV